MNYTVTIQAQKGTMVEVFCKGYYDGKNEIDLYDFDADHLKADEELKYRLDIGNFILEWLRL